jgi:hypothetical protein
MLDDAINYIKKIGEEKLATHLSTILNRGSFSVIEEELSLWAGLSASYFAKNVGKRNALSALLLCQRVYFSDLWGKTRFLGSQESHPYNYLPSSWKEESLAYWSKQTEAQIIGGIRVFSITNTSSLYRLADIAYAHKQGPNTSLLTITRETWSLTEYTCYSAVMAWLFKSGLVSYPWYLNNSSASDEVSLKKAFGPGERIWNANRLFTENDSLPPIPPGYIVHLYVDNLSRWNGHWLVSLGNGLACGINNDVTDGTNRGYSNRCSLNNQFLYGYKHALPNASGHFEQGVADIIDPRQIPGRMQSLFI